MNKYLLDETEPTNTHLNYPVEHPKKKQKCLQEHTGNENIHSVVDDLRLRLEELEDFVFRLVEEATSDQEDSLEDISETEE